MNNREICLLLRTYRKIIGLASRNAMHSYTELWVAKMIIATGVVLSIEALTSAREQWMSLIQSMLTRTICDSCNGMSLYSLLSLFLTECKCFLTGKSQVGMRASKKDSHNEKGGVSCRESHDTRIPRYDTLSHVCNLMYASNGEQSYELDGFAWIFYRLHHINSFEYACLV